LPAASIFKTLPPASRTAKGVKDWDRSKNTRGQFLMVATDDGTYKAEPRYLTTEDYDPKGINISSYGNRLAFAKKQGWKHTGPGALPVDMFPPNPLAFIP
jgi:sulfatase modifying factor 1